MSYTRRDFLKATMGAATMLSFASPAPNLLVRAATAGAAQQDDRDTTMNTHETVLRYAFDPKTSTRSTRIWASIPEWKRFHVCTRTDT